MNRDFGTLQSVRVGTYFPGWDDYVRRYTDGDTRRSLRWSLEHINSDLRILRFTDESLRDLPMRETIGRARTVPWPTFVLGSGCLGVGELQDATLEVSESLRVALAACTDDVWLGQQALQFIDQLAIDRTGQRLESAGLGRRAGALRDAAEWEFVAQVAMAAHLLTRLYGEAIARTAQIVSETHREEVLIGESSGGWIEVHRDLVDPLARALKVLAKPPGVRGQIARVSLASLASSIDDAVTKDRKVHRAHVELLTAFAWFFLTEGTNVYPDWSDLLLFEAFVDADVPAYAAKAPAWHDSRLKPRQTAIGAVDQVAQWLTDRLGLIAEDSWRARDQGPDRAKPTKRAALYDAVAALLGQQADNYHSYEDLAAGSSHKPPLPTCFVTTFDLELELAMWQRSLTQAEPSPFIVILPVLLRAPGPHDAVSLRWIWREVVPSRDRDALQNLRESDPSAWTLLSEETLPPPLQNRPEVWGRTPMIVRLAGSPLMSVHLNDADGLRQALLLDEYTALSQTVQDLTSAAQESTGRIAGLPEDLTRTDMRTESAYMPRYWMLLGAQLSDPGIKLRLLSSQITAAQANTKAGIRSMITGVAINQRSRPADRDVFHWYGFDVVRDDVVQSEGRSLAEDLRELHTELEAVFKRIHAEIDGARRTDTLTGEGERL